MPKPNGDGTHEHAHLVGHPAFLAGAGVPQSVHLSAWYGSDGIPLLQGRRPSLRRAGSWANIRSRCCRGVPAQSPDRANLSACASRHLLHRYSAGVRAGESWRCISMWIAQAKLLDDVVTHVCRVALAGEGCDGAVGKMIPQAAQFPVFRAKLMTPFRNAVRLVNREV